MPFALTKNENEYLRDKKKNEVMHRLFLNPNVIFVDSTFLPAEKKQFGSRILQEIQIEPGSYALVLN